MPVSNVQVGLLGGLVIIGLLGFQFLEIEKSEPVPDESSLLAESGLMEELRALKAQLEEY